MTLRQDALDLHRNLRGKIEIHNRVSLDKRENQDNETLSLIYTPGVAYIASEIQNNKEQVYDFTSKWNNVAIICDGTRVLGLGNIGPEGALPVMEGKSVLFKILADINAIPLCINIQDKEEIIKFVKAIQPGFGAVNIEDIESPKVLEIVDRLEKELDIPVFHDDQHGTSVITFAALLNALRIVNKSIDKIAVIVAGAGSAGYGIFKLLQKAGCNNIIVVDSKGGIYEGRDDIDDGNVTHRETNPYKEEIAMKSNHDKIKGRLEEIIIGCDVFIGVSGKGSLLDARMVKSMKSNPIIFALSNPDPEILPSTALEAGAKIVATGRSDFPNQVNNAIVFPYLLRTLLDLRVKTLSVDLLLEIAKSIANLIEDSQLNETHIIPKVNDPRLLQAVSETLKKTIKIGME